MNVIITGISKGLGLKTAQSLLKKGWTIYGISRNKTKELDELMVQYSGKLKWLQYDLDDTKKIQKIIFKDWIGIKTPVHGLVNNAAMAYDDIVTNLNLDSLEKMYRVNVFTPIVLTKYVIRHMLLHQTKGSIVHVSSISVHSGYKGLSMYAWGEIGVRSNCIVVGFMETEMSSSLSETQKNRIYQRTSMKKPVDVNSVAETISFLLSEDAKSITGQNIHVDNGTI